MSARWTHSLSTLALGLGSVLLAGCQGGHHLDRFGFGWSRSCSNDECIADSRCYSQPGDLRRYSDPRVAPTAPQHPAVPEGDPNSIVPPVPGSAARPVLPPQASGRRPRSILHRVRYGLRRLHTDEDQHASHPPYTPAVAPRRIDQPARQLVTRPARLGSADDPNAIEPWPFTPPEQRVWRAKAPRTFEPDTHQPAGNNDAWRYRSARVTRDHARGTDPVMNSNPPVQIAPRNAGNPGYHSGPNFGPRPETTHETSAAKPLWQRTSYVPRFVPSGDEPVIRNFR